MKIILKSLLVIALFFLLSTHSVLAEVSSIPDQDSWVTDGNVNAITTDPVSGVTYIGGYFNYVGPRIGYGVPIDTSTGLATSTFPEVNGQINSSVSDGFGGWYIGGWFTKVGNLNRNYIAHILADGTVDSDWNPNPNGQYVSSLAISGTTVYASGSFTTIGGQTRNYIAALDATTGLATTWNPNADGVAYSLAISGTTVY